MLCPASEVPTPTSSRGIRSVRTQRRWASRARRLLVPPGPRACARAQLVTLVHRCLFRRGERPRSSRSLWSMGHRFSMRSRIHSRFKTKYRVSNWAEYDRALVQRGDITLWIREDAIASWKPAPTGRSGAQWKFSDSAIEIALTLRLVFNFAGRALFVWSTRPNSNWHSLRGLRPLILAA